MLPEKYRWIGVQFEPEGDPDMLVMIARELVDDGNLEGAAVAYDRAYGIDPTSEDVREARARLLDRLAVVEHGVRFRYIPGGAFLMGCDTREEDERPWHPVWLSPFWLTETPVSWTGYCRLMGWEPPGGFPRDGQAPAGELDLRFAQNYAASKIRFQYCEDRTTQAGDWHSHAPGQTWQSDGKTVTAQELFGTPPRDAPEAPWRYDTKPMIAVDWQEIEEVAARLSTDRVRYGCPTEAQWEKAARGGLIGARYTWGDEPPTHDRCDFDHFGDFSIRPMTTFPPNGYGLYAVNGGVWEWTRDWYDREYYRHSPAEDPEGPAEGQEKVLRGGSWADCADALTVTFRMSRGSGSWAKSGRSAAPAPNVGFRLCRTVVG